MRIERINIAKKETNVINPPWYAAQGINLLDERTKGNPEGFVVKSSSPGRALGAG